ncbi:MAG: VWA domain-containing protein, partial [Candidatus Sumerlaeota bacterium]
LMARPVLTGMNALLGKSQISLVVAIDDSASMNASEKTVTQFKEAVTEAERIVQELPRGSEVSIVWMASGVVVGPTFDHDRIQAALLEVSRGQGMTRPGQALDTAVSLLDRGHYPDRQLVVISDFQEQSWPTDSTAERNAVAARLAGMDPAPSLTLFQVGEEVSENIGVDSIELSHKIISAGRRVRVRADIQNYGKDSWRDLRVFFRVDGQERSASQIQLSPDQTAQVLFSHSFDEPGSHYIEVFADGDPLREDNGRMAATPVWDQLPVLLMSTPSGGGRFNDPAAFLKIALEPFAATGRTGEKDLISTRRIRARDFKAKDIEGGVKVVVMANVRELNDSQASLLGEFVENGGGLIIFPGSQVNIANHNQLLYNAGDGLLPLPYKPVSQMSDTGISILSERFDHPAMEIFNDPRNGNISEARIREWLPFEHADETMPANTRVVANYENNDIFLAEKEYGQGRVIAATTACDVSWSNLPMRASYLPLMQELVIYLASRVTPPRNLSPNETLAALLPRSADGNVALVTNPAGEQTEITAVGKQTHALVEYTKTQRPGLYLLDPPAGEVMHYVVRTPKEESNLALLDGEAFEVLATDMNARAVTSGAEYEKFERRRRFGLELWKMLLLVLLGLIFLEMYLEQRFANQV